MKLKQTLTFELQPIFVIARNITKSLFMFLVFFSITDNDQMQSISTKPYFISK